VDNLLTFNKITEMRRLKPIIIVSIIAWFFQACSSNKKGDSKDKTDSTTIAKIDSIAKDSGTKMNIADSTSKMSNLIEKGDINFVVAAASDNLTEVALGKMAEQKGVNRRVKNFGRMMVMDHTKANDQLMTLAKNKKISLPTAPDADGRKEIDELTKRSGADFDQAYVNYMVDDHKKDIKEFQDAAKNCADPDIKVFAYKTLRVLQKHLDAISTIHDSMK
jgi:putative membrane protein